MDSPVSLDQDSVNTALPLRLPSRGAVSVSPRKVEQFQEDDGYATDELADSPKSDGFQLPPQLSSHNAEYLTIGALHGLIHEGAIDLNPPYQRDIVWTAAKQAMLIDSLFRGFYIPPVVFAVTKDEDGVPTRVCVDGKQRLTSIQRFVDGQLPYIQSKKQHYYYTSPAKAQRLQLPDETKKWFSEKLITCVEYGDLTPEEEREIFQRVQMGMTLTTAEKLAAIDSPWADWISKLETIEGGLSQVLVWDTKRGREFQNVAQFVYCCDGYPDENVPSAPKMEKWLSRVDPPGEQFKQDIDEALDEFGRIAVDPQLNMGFKINQRLAPVEFVFIGVLLYVLRKSTSIEKAKAIHNLRTQIRNIYADIRMNSKVGASLWTLINTLKHNPITAMPLSPSKRKRKMSEDSDYHPSPIKSLGKNPKTRSRRE
ncbi:hypothetical protein C8R43DRAFT_1117504 [Mycena crocata]|nr:hypothetical protein C8R43DRAFT_1117504 [Mycena crocata]